MHVGRCVAAWAGHHYNPNAQVELTVGIMRIMSVLRMNVPGV
jgi:hypothetical protein